MTIPVKDEMDITNPTNGDECDQGPIASPGADSKIDIAGVFDIDLNGPAQTAIDADTTSILPNRGAANLESHAQPDSGVSSFDLHSSSDDPILDLPEFQPPAAEVIPSSPPCSTLKADETAKATQQLGLTPLQKLEQARRKMEACIDELEDQLNSHNYGLAAHPGSFPKLPLDPNWEGWRDKVQHKSNCTCGVCGHKKFKPKAEKGKLRRQYEKRKKWYECGGTHSLAQCLNLTEVPDPSMDSHNLGQAIEVEEDGYDHGGHFGGVETYAQTHATFSYSNDDVTKTEQGLRPSSAPMLASPPQMAIPAMTRPLTCSPSSMSWADMDEDEDDSWMSEFLDDEPSQGPSMPEASASPAEDPTVGPMDIANNIDSTPPIPPPLPPRPSSSNTVEAQQAEEEPNPRAICETVRKYVFNAYVNLVAKLHVNELLNRYEHHFDNYLSGKYRPITSE